MFEGIETFRKRLAEGEKLIGCAVTFTDPLLSEALADSVDYLWYDMEHSAMSPGVLNAHLMAARGRRKAAIVRVAGGDTAHIKPVLDAGAPGIIVPQVRTVEEVERIVADCRYPPSGRRGFGPRVPIDFGRTPLGEYVERADRAVFVSVMIETVEAVEAIEQIVAVTGLDSIVLGPFDLSGSLGALGRFDRQWEEATDHVIRAARAANVSVGAGMDVDIDFALESFRRGIQWIQLGSDFGLMIQRADEAIKAVRRGWNS